MKLESRLLTKPAVSFEGLTGGWKFTFQFTFVAVGRPCGLICGHRAAL